MHAPPVIAQFHSPSALPLTNGTVRPPRRKGSDQRRTPAPAHAAPTPAHLLPAHSAPTTQKAARRLLGENAPSRTSGQSDAQLDSRTRLSQASASCRE